jgi:hypothetical protein
MTLSKSLAALFPFAVVASADTYPREHSLYPLSLRSKHGRTIAGDTDVLSSNVSRTPPNTHLCVLDFLLNLLMWQVTKESLPRVDGRVRPLSKWGNQLALFAIA